MQVLSSLAGKLQPNECMDTPDTYDVLNTSLYSTLCTVLYTVLYTKLYTKLYPDVQWLAERTYSHRNAHLIASCILYLTLKSILF